MKVTLTVTVDVLASAVPLHRGQHVREVIRGNAESLLSAMILGSDRDGVIPGVRSVAVAQAGPTDRDALFESIARDNRAAFDALADHDAHADDETPPAAGDGGSAAP